MKNKSKSQFQSSWMLPLLCVQLLLTVSCLDTKSTKLSPENEQQSIINMLDSFNIAAANADYQTYFNFFDDDAVFMGTDATEHWDKSNFMMWAKPYFDNKKTWNFKSIDRHIYFAETGNLAWFDELLNTQMKICRGSGVVIKEDNRWKIKQYVLSMTIPNSEVDTIIKIKSPVEDKLINKLQYK